MLGLDEVVLGGPQGQQPRGRKREEQRHARLDPRPPGGPAACVERDQQSGDRDRERVRVPDADRQRGDPEGAQRGRPFPLSIEDRQRISDNPKANVKFKNPIASEKLWTRGQKKSAATGR